MIKKHVVNNRSNANINVHWLIHANVVTYQLTYRKTGKGGVRGY